MTDISVKSDFAVLDVKDGRGALVKHFSQIPRGMNCPDKMRIPVTITGWIDGINSDDDGVSREFSVHVSSVALNHGEQP